MTGRVWRIALNDTYSSGLYKIGLLLHTLPTTCLMRDSNLSTRGHVRRECHHPNLWQRRASFFEVHIHRCTKHTFFPTNSFVEDIITYSKHFVITGTSDNTMCFHCDIGIRIWVPGDIAFAEHARWSPFLCLCYIRKGQNFHWWKPANSPPIWHRRHLHCSIKRINLEYTLRNSFFINSIHGPMSQENNNNIQNMYSPVDG